MDDLEFTSAVPLTQGEILAEQNGAFDSNSQGAILAEQNSAFDTPAEEPYRYLTQEEVDAAGGGSTAEERDLATLLKQNAANLKLPNGQTPPADQSKSIAQVLKDAGVSDKVIASVVQGGFGMLAGASAGKMKQAEWDREDAAIKTARDLRAKNSYAGKVGQMNWTQPTNTGLLASIKK